MAWPDLVGARVRGSGLCKALSPAHNGSGKAQLRGLAFTAGPLPHTLGTPELGPCAGPCARDRRLHKRRLVRTRVCDRECMGAHLLLRRSGLVASPSRIALLCWGPQPQHSALLYDGLCTELSIKIYRSIIRGRAGSRYRVRIMRTRYRALSSESARVCVRVMRVWVGQRGDLFKSQ